MSIWNWCLSCCGWRPSKASTSAGSPWDRSETVTVNKDAILYKTKSARNEVGLHLPQQAKKWENWKKEHLEEVGPGEHERGTKLALGHVEQAWWGARLPWAEAPVWNSWCCGSLCSFSGPWVCLFVGFGLHEWRNMVHTLVTWVLIGSAENVGRGNKPGNWQSHVF